MDSSYDSRIDLTLAELNDRPHSDTDLPNKVFRDLIGEFSGDWEGKEDVGVVCCVGQGWWLKELTEEWGCHVVLASGSLNRFWELEDLVNPPVPKLPGVAASALSRRAGREESSRVVYRTEEQP